MIKTLMALLGVASALIANDPVVNELNALSIVQENHITILKVKDEGNIYFVKGETARVPVGQLKQRIDFYVTKDKKILITGNGIYTDTNERVAFPMEKSTIEGKEAFSYGSGSKVLYVFTDPECPYCKQFEKKMATLKEQYTFRVYVFPLPFHADAIPMSKWMLNGKDGNQMGERLIALANGSTEYKNMVLSADEDKRLTDIINRQLGVAEAAEVRSTPTVLDSSLHKVNWPSL